jgi:hypothetical protein
LATVTTDRELIEAVVAEMNAGIECAVDFWVAQIEGILQDPRLTTLGRLQAVQEIVKQYRNSTQESGIGSHGYVA